MVAASRKAQVSIVSLVLVAGITVALVATAYTWGKPLIDKRTAVSEFSLAEAFMLNLDESIIDLINAGEGEFTMNMPLGAMEAIYYGASDPDSNSIIIEFISTQPMIVEGKAYLRSTGYQDTEEIGTYGETEPSIITLEGEREGSVFKMKLKIHYRELDTKTSPKRGYIIAVNKLNPITVGGSDKITVSFDGTEEIDAGADNGGPLIVSRIRVEVV